ncbi:MAG: hypothetical protein KDA80_20065, partial [Planctomycetaceae bacterium]|nr:hypothetical protein [Planctomycetaceae bacterium]
QTIIQTKQEIVREKILGWPYDRLGPHEIKQDLTAAQAVAIVFLVAWWVFVVMSKIPGQEHIVMFAFAAMFGNLLAAIRLITYVWGYAPPISLWGRIRTGRWIIPGYDVVFVAPLMILLLASVMAYAVFKLRMDPLMAVPLLVAAQLYATVKFPPGLMDWRLTHNHRIIPAIGSQAAELQQTQ